MDEYVYSNDDSKEIHSWPRVTGSVSPVNEFGTVSVGKKGAAAR
jgi:hypothetical protein